MGLVMGKKIQNSVCAVMVVYYPDSSFEERLDSLILQVEILVIVDNSKDGIISNTVKILTEEKSNIIIVQNFINLGISKALNQGIHIAKKFHCKWLLTLDQDTHLYEDAVKILLNISNKVGTDVKVIGGNYFDTHNNKLYINAGSKPSYKKVKTVITSGCLVDVNFAEQIGSFREDYFIDQVDREYCLRVRAHGCKVVISTKPVMDHCVGEKGGATLPLVGTFPNHKPVRKYYISRNSILTIIKYWRHEPIWCVQRFIRLLMGLVLILLFEKQKKIKCIAFYKGLKDAFNNRLGECPHQLFMSYQCKEDEWVL